MDPSRAELQEKIKAQGDIVRKLKSEKVEKSLVRIMKFFLTIYFIIFEIDQICVLKLSSKREGYFYYL